MTNLIELLQSQMSDQMIGQLSQSVNVSDTQQTSKATNAIFSILTNALAKNTATSNGASSLASALDNDHDGSILDNLSDLLGGRSTNLNPRATNGAGILKHILGGNQNNVIDVISQLSGMNKNSAGSLMIKLAPMILGMLGKQKRQNNFDQGGLSDFLNQSAKQTNQDAGQQDILSKLLDRDGDGNVMDDVAGMGMKILGNLFKK